MSDRKTATAIDEQCRHAAINGRVILSCRFDMEEHAEALDLVALGGPFERLCKKNSLAFLRS